MPLNSDYKAGRPPLPTKITASDIVEVQRAGVVYSANEAHMPVTPTEYATVLDRLRRLEGIAPGPTPSPGPAPAPPPTSYVFDFTLSGQPPANVAVARAGVTGTYINSLGRVAISAANTPRIQHDSQSLAVIGLLCEKQRTNSMTYGQFIGTGVTWSDLSTPLGTFTSNYSTAPDGSVTSATRLQIAASAGYFGKRHGISGLPGAAEIHAVIYAKANVTGSQIGGVTGSWVTPSSTGNGERFEFMHAATTGFNVDLVGSSVAVDVSLWGLHVVEGGKLGESLILTNGLAVTRPKEVVTFSGLVAGTYDVTVTFPDNSTQVFSNQVVAATSWPLDADNLVNQYSMKAVRFYPAGTAPVPAPAPTPAPAPAPAPGAVWTSDMVTVAMADSDGPNEFVIKYLTSTVGWRGQASQGWGRRWNYAAPRSWNWENDALGDTYWYEYFEPWFALFEEVGSTGTGYIDIKDFQFQLRYTGNLAWTRIPCEIGWCSEYTLENNNFSWSDTPTPRRAGLDGGTSFQALISPHGGTGKIRTSPLADSNLAGVMVSCLFRKDPRSDSTWKGGMQISGDPKPPSQGSLPYYEPFHTSKSKRATTSWQRITSVCVQPDGQTLTDRMMTKADFAAIPPLL